MSVMYKQFYRKDMMLDFSFDYENFYSHDCSIGDEFNSVPDDEWGNNNFLFNDKFEKYNYFNSDRWENIYE